MNNQLKNVKGANFYMEKMHFESTLSSTTNLSIEDELYVQELPMSKRLLNVLERNGIYDLSMISQYTYENIMHFRNMGDKTYAELKEVCNKYQVPLMAPMVTPPIPDALKETGLPIMFLSECVRTGFLTLDDMNRMTTQVLFNLCRNNYILAQQIYQSLLKKGITFQSWEDSYLFEHLSVRYAMRLWECFHITTVSQLLAMDMKTISGARGVGKKGVKEIAYFRKTLIKP